MGRLDDSRRAPVAVLALLGTFVFVAGNRGGGSGSPCCVRAASCDRAGYSVKTAVRASTRNRLRNAIINTKYEYKYSSVKYSGRDELLRRGTRAARALIPSHI